MGWFPWSTIDRAIKEPFLFCEEGKKPVYIGRFGEAYFREIVQKDMLLYCSYTNTLGKNYFRNGNFIVCGLRPTHWMYMPKAYGC